MIREIETTGKTIEEAIENAYAMLGVDRDKIELSIEVIDRPKSGFLGIGSTPAKVRASYEVADEPKEEPEYKIGRTREPRRQERVEVINEEDGPTAILYKEDMTDGETAEQQSKPRRERNRRSDRPRREHQDAPSEPRTEHVERIPDVTDEEVELRKNAAVTFLEGLLQRMGVEVSTDASINTENKSITISLSGEKVGSLIGRRGETLGAIQHITGYMANKGKDERVRVIVDAEGYREKREEALQGLARRTALKVVRLRHNITLEPMNAYERHIIHTALQDWRDVSTFSTGAEPRRAVVISYTPGGGKGSSGDRSERRDGDRRRDRRDRPRRERPEQSAPAEPKERTPLPEQVWE